MHLPEGAVLQKMAAEGIANAEEIIKMDPNSPAPGSGGGGGEGGGGGGGPPLKDDPKYAKFFKMCVLL